MGDGAFLLGVDAQAGQVRRGRVSAFADDGSVAVVPADRDWTECWCDVLRTSESSQLALALGDTVVLLLPPGDDDRGVVLGRIGPSCATTDPGAEAPDELVVEARQSLVLRCGDGSITIREDGKILIKGVDLVSHAKRINRIKGGAVAIN